MPQRRVRVLFMRGGTSRAILFRREDLPADPADWEAIFLIAIGSPDPYGRQLDGMGGGISSLSKVAVIGSPSHPAADVDYTFGQVSVTEPSVDYRANCGNISSAVGPFAIDEKLVIPAGPEAVVRIHNTSTKVALIAPPRNATTLAGEQLEAESMDITVRMLSMGRPHRAVPLTGAMCLAVAARIEGSVVHRLARAAESSDADLRVAHPSGVTPVAARVMRQSEQWIAERVVVYRTARRLMEGSVLVPVSRLRRS
jgi:2-methylaconitate cis-trans-isomerase PrpF